MSEAIPPEGAPDQAFLEHRVKVAIGAFDIWAQALSMSAAPTDDAAVAFEELLNAFENMIVERSGNQQSSYIPKLLLVSKVKLGLSRRRHYWTGKMLRKVREHKEALHILPKASAGAEPLAAIVSEPPTTLETVGDPAAKLRVISEIESALKVNDRKNAVQLRRKLDGCQVKQLWTEAFESRRAAHHTKQTAFNRWQVSRADTPLWVDALMRARLLR